jgi:hypothetical protein
LLVNAESRASLMVGIIGTALKEHVFSALWFGGTEKQIEELENQQEQLRDPEDERLFLSSSSLICQGLRANFISGRNMQQVHD